MDIRFTDGPEDMVTWIASTPGVMQRASHALVVGDGTWLIDPVDAPEARRRLAAMPPVAGVIQLLDRHGRDCTPLSREFGVPLIRTPSAATPGIPFDVIVVRSTRRWTESALWWPTHRALVVAEAMGTATYYLASPGDVIGPHPCLRIAPPHTLMGYPAEHVLTGHGDPVHRLDAGALVDAAIATARRRTPRWALALLVGSVRRAARGAR